MQMCGRYKLQDPEWVEADFSNVFPTLATAVRRPRYNVAPGQLVLAVTGTASGRTLEQMKWGIEPPWKKGPPQVINARGEKLAESRFWKPMLEQRRCAIPADGFYEWKAASGSIGKKQPFLFTRNDGGGFWFAGLYSPARAEDAVAPNECVVVTVAPNELVEDVHDRMPAMLDSDQLDAWLADDAELAQGQLAPYRSTEMSALAIGSAIGNASREGAELIEPAEPGGSAQASSLF